MKRAGPLSALFLLACTCGEEEGGSPTSDSGTPTSDASTSPSNDGGGTSDAGPMTGDGEENPVEGLIYAERWRPQFHYSPPFGWMNDPNGMVEVDGTWHLFYQSNPLGSGFGFLSWGHAISDDLVRWKPVNLAIPFEGRTAIFSGSAVVDRRNTTQLCDPDAASRGDCVVAIYTANVVSDDGFDQNQNLSISNNGGFDFTRFAGNPVLDIDEPEFRDPKVFWHGPTSRWVMVITRPLARTIDIYTSPDMKAWTRASEFGPAGATGGVWECPDLFPLPIPDRPDEQKWVMKVDLNPGHVAGGSGGQYFLGSFDGTTFTPDGPVEAPRWVDWGTDFYCATTWADSPDDQTRWIGWMSNWAYAGDVPTDPWRGQMTLPREVRLVRRSSGELALADGPVSAFSTLRVGGTRLSGTADAITQGLEAFAEPGEGWELELDVRLPEQPLGSPVELRLEQVGAGPYAILRYLPDGTLELERPAQGNARVNDAFPAVMRAPLPAEGGRVRLRVIVDRSSIEVFAADGAVSVTALLFPTGAARPPRLVAPSGVRFEASAWGLDASWR